MNKHGNKPPPYHFHRENKSTAELVELSEKPFIPATDPFWKSGRNDIMDKEQSCACMNSESIFEDV